MFSYLVRLGFAEGEGSPGQFWLKLILATAGSRKGVRMVGGVDDWSSWEMAQHLSSYCFRCCLYGLSLWSWLWSSPSKVDGTLRTNILTERKWQCGFLGTRVWKLNQCSLYQLLLVKQLQSLESRKGYRSQLEMEKLLRIWDHILKLFVILNLKNNLFFKHLNTMSVFKDYIF